MTADRLRDPQQLDRLRDQLQRQRSEGRRIISVCSGTGCLACGCESVLTKLRDKITAEGLRDQVEVKATGCSGPCEWGPLMTIFPEKTFYIKVTPDDVDQIVEDTIKNEKIVEELLYKDPTTGELITREDDIPFFKQQMRLLIGHNSRIDPTAINDYLVLGGYGSLAKVLTDFTPDQVIDEVKASGLRGRGGGGLPTGQKWAAARQSGREPKYVICSADEGDPGAFMDRSLLEGNPHSVIEGMLIGAYAVGSEQGLVYLRNEYPRAYKNLQIAIDAARQLGLLGRNILGTDFSFDLDVSRGGGAYICGESTAMMASVGGRAGEPRAKYVHVVEAGLWEKPSVLNNVETWANVRVIIDRGAAWYNSIGTEKSKGTKVFALTGKIKNTGLVEVPMGISLREIMFDIGGGVRGDRRFKAVQMGGPSGGTLIVDRAGAINRYTNRPISLLDLPVDFDELAGAGSMMGSGGMVIMDQDSCMVDVARYFLSFLQEESCGKCLPCREGIRTMLEILSRIAEGKGVPEDVDQLEKLSQVIVDSSLCQIGGSAPKPILSTIKYFRSEYLAHIEDRRCPAGVCRELVSHAITDKCTGCCACVKSCPTGAIIGEPKRLHTIDQSLCTQCGACFQLCADGAVVRVKRGEGTTVQRKAMTDATTGPENETVMVS